jgi:signal recognition particle subunit SRP54
MFESLSDRLQAVFKKLGGRGRLSETDVREAMKQVRIALLEADVSLKVVREFVAAVTEKAIGEDVLKSLTPSQQVIKIVHGELLTLLGGASAPLAEASVGPTVIMLVGLQGAGKTTHAAKLGLLLRKKSKRPLLVAADVYRPAAITQLEALGRQLSIPVHAEGTAARPADIARHGVQRARDDGHNYVIVDTAGRLQIDDALMAELDEIQAATGAIERILVVDAMIGQEAARVAETFHQRVGLTGVMLTKIDGDARGGAALSIRAVTGVPIKFLGTGEKVELSTIEVFHPDRLASRILGMGDVLSLIERAEQTYDADEARRMQQRLSRGTFDFEDFLSSMQQMRRLGPLQQIIGMIPGMDKLARGEELLSERELKRVEAIIFSMTREERRNPDIIKTSRKERIARGSGTKVHDVSALISQFRQMQRMMKKAGRNGRIDPREMMRHMR